MDWSSNKAENENEMQILHANVNGHCAKLMQAMATATQNLQRNNLRSTEKVFKQNAQPIQASAWNICAFNAAVRLCCTAKRRRKGTRKESSRTKPANKDRQIWVWNGSLYVLIHSHKITENSPIKSYLAAIAAISDDCIQKVVYKNIWATKLWRDHWSGENNHKFWQMRHEYRHDRTSLTKGEKVFCYIAALCWDFFRWRRRKSVEFPTFLFTASIELVSEQFVFFIHLN